MVALTEQREKDTSLLQETCYVWAGKALTTVSRVALRMRIGPEGFGRVHGWTKVH